MNVTISGNKSCCLASGEESTIYGQSGYLKKDRCSISDGFLNRFKVSNKLNRRPSNWQFDSQIGLYLAVEIVVAKKDRETIK